MALHLIVTADFADFKRGDCITDPDKVAEIRDSHNAARVVPINAPDDKPAAPAPSAA